MKKTVFTLALCGLLAGCAGTQQRAGFRELSEAEKSGLHKALSSNLGGAAGTQFRWGPIAASGASGAHVGYCAEIDARNPDGSRSGYRRFFALLIPNASGELTSGTLQAVAANSSAGDPAATQRVNASCAHWGYAG